MTAAGVGSPGDEQALSRTTEVQGDYETRLTDREEIHG